MSIITCVQDNISNGKTASEAVAELEASQDGQMLPQLQVVLQPKGRKQKKAIKDSESPAPEQSSGSSIWSITFVSIFPSS